MTISSAGQARWTPREYEQLAREGYLKNVIVYRCVAALSQAVSDLPVLLYDGEEEIGDGPVIDLLAKPTPFTTREGLFSQLVSYFLISGNAYIEAVSGSAGGEPQELHALPPQRMKVVPSRLGTPAAYEYSVNGLVRRWDVDPVTGEGPIAHWKDFHPTDDYYGMGALEAAAVMIDQHNEASIWNMRMLQNGARPSGALVYAPKDGGKMTTEQFERLKSSLEATYQGAANSGRPMLLEGGLDWKEMSITPKDMDWLSGRNQAARDIAQAFKVPPQLIGVPDAQTYSNYSEARLAFYEDAVIPLGNRLLSVLDCWLLPKFDMQGLHLKFDLDEIPALEPRRAEKRASLQGSDYLTINEKRAALGFDPLPDGDVLLIGGGQVPLSDLTAPLPSSDAPASAQETYGK